METDYKKLYEEAVNKIKSIIAEKKSQGLTNCLFEGDLNEIFPELRESEGERIRKEIINYFKCQSKEEPSRKDIHNKWIAWLEKQDTKKFEKELDKAYKCADEVQYRKGYEDAKRELEKQGEQKPAWSKEDITNYSKVLFCLQTLTFPNDDERKELITWLKKQCEQNSADSYCQDNCKGFQETGKCFADGECKAKREAGQNIEEEFDDFFNLESVIDIVEMYGKGEVDLYGSNVTSELKWLKSLRDRVYWKPTEEQMEDLKYAINMVDKCCEDSLQSLYNDLKKF